MRIGELAAQAGVSVQAVRYAKELADGYRFHLGAASETFLTAAEWIALVTGPDEVKASLTRRRR